MAPPPSRPGAFERLRELPLVGRAMDWGMGPRAVSRRTRSAGARIAGLRATESICPYCAVGCSQVVYTRGGELVDIEGNPRSPINQGTLCPKGAATRQLVQQPDRLTKVLYRRPRGTEWEELELETAMDMIAERVIEARERGWQDRDRDGRVVNRTLGFAHLGGATLDNEENYLIKKLFMALGAVQIENQARICHSSTVRGLGTSFGRGGATDFLQDLQHSQCVLIQGSSMAEAHPVGFRWVMKARERGAEIIHVDPRFSRTSAHAHQHVAIRPGTDIPFLVVLIRHVIETESFFRDYVVSRRDAGGASVVRGQPAPARATRRTAPARAARPPLPRRQARRDHRPGAPLPAPPSRPACPPRRQRALPGRRPSVPHRVGRGGKGVSYGCSRRRPRGQACVGR
jgi:formate dehydrogenase major subunit